MKKDLKNTDRHYMLRFISIAVLVLLLLASLSSCKHTDVHVDVDVDDVVTKTEPESTNPTITVNIVSANRGDTDVEITVSIKNNPGIVGMTLSLEYNEDAMTLTGVGKGNALGEMTFTTPKDLSSGCHFPWDAEYVLPENATNGTILTLTFSISDNAQSGNYPLTITYDDGAIIDNDMNPVDMAIVNGSITIE